MIELGGKSYGPGNPMIVAEIGPNHNGDLRHALQLIEEAAKAGADAVKFQCYGPAEMTVPSEQPHFMIPDGQWKGSLWDLYERGQTPLDWIPLMGDCADENGIAWFCSVFHPSAVEKLEGMGCPAYKIASPEAEWDELLFAVAETRKLMIVSDGMLTQSDAARIRFITGDTIILRCVSQYPAKPEEYGFRDIARAPTLAIGTTGDFMHPHRSEPATVDGAPLWGLSDHSCSLTTAVVAASMGASMIEAHLMLSPCMYEQDNLPLDFDHSLNPTLFRAYAQEAKTAAKMAYGTRAEVSDAPWRRRLVWARDMKAGDIAERSDLLCVRSAEGALANEVWTCLGGNLPEDAAKWSPVLAYELEV